MSDYPSRPQPNTPPAAPFGGPNRPSPAGLGLAGAGVLLLAVGSMIPQLSLSGPDDATEWLAASGAHYTGLPGLAPALVLLVLVVWTAVGVSPGLQWVTKFGGIGIAVLTTAAALNPVLEINGAMGALDRDERVSASAGGGIWLYIIAAILLAVSIFMMRWAPKPAAPVHTGQYPAQPQAPQQQQPQQPPTQNGWPQVPPQS